MLSIKEKLVLKAVLTSCGDRQTCLLSPADLLCRLPHNAGISEKRLNEILKCLELDGYVDVVLSDRYGEIVYCITLTSKARAFGRESVQNKRYITYRIIIAVFSAVITFFVGRLLYYFIK